jgi:hypothetical protein
MTQDRFARDVDQAFRQDIGMGLEPDAFAGHRYDDVHNDKYMDKYQIVNIPAKPKHNFQTVWKLCFGSFIL